MNARMILGSLIGTKASAAALALAAGMQTFTALSDTVIIGNVVYDESGSLPGRKYIGHDGNDAAVTIGPGVELIWNQDGGVTYFSGNESGRFETHATMDIYGTLHTPLYCTPYGFNDGMHRGEEFGRITLHEGGHLVSRYLVKNDDPSVAIGFNGGQMSFNGDFLGGCFYVAGWGLSCEGIGLNPIRLNIVNDGTGDGPYVAVRESVNNGTLRLTGSGGLVISGSGKVRFGTGDAFVADYVGDTVFSHSCLRNAGGRVPVGPGKGIVRVESGVFDLNGVDFSANNVVSDGGIVTNSSPSVANVSVGMSDEDIALSAGFHGNINIVKQGSGCMSLVRPIRSVRVAAGSLLPLGTIAEFPHYRFFVESCQGLWAEAMQIGEFKFLFAGRDVTQGFSSATCRPDGSQPSSGESPSAALDGDLTTKFCDPHMFYINEDRTCWLQIDYPQPLKVDAYTWSTGNDCFEVNSNKNRSPKNFRLQGSQDGSTWVDIDVREDFVQPDVGANSWIGTEFSEWAGAACLTGGSRVLKDAHVEVEAGAEFLVPEGMDVAVASLDLNDGGSVALHCGSALELAGGCLEGRVNGTGTLRVVSGRVSFGSETQAKWIRLNISRWDDSISKVFQLSEFAIYDELGGRVNANLSQEAVGTAATDLPSGSFCVRDDYVMQLCGASEQPSCLFDANTETKFCTTVSDMRPIVLTMHLPENAGTLSSYNFCTANDCPERSPVDWTLEASVDGVTWFEVDRRSNVVRPTTLYAWYNGAALGPDAAFAPHTAASIMKTDMPLGEDVALEVDFGATLDASAVTNGCISEIVYDYSKGGGSIVGIKLSKEGLLRIEKVPPNVRLNEVPLQFELLKAVNPEDIRNWDVYVEGCRRRMRPRILGDSITLLSDGFAIILR